MGIIDRKLPNEDKMIKEASRVGKAIKEWLFGDDKKDSKEKESKDKKDSKDKK